tara:strand:- start:860 stop:1276 length:417 start_codon:yes stop_codon:yes gene_type:complete
MPRRLAIHTLLAIGVCIPLVGCKSIKSIGQPSEENPKAVGGDSNVTTPPIEGSQARQGITPVSYAQQGKVMLVDQSLGFCVVDFMFVAKMPPAEQRYFVYRENQQVGEIVTTSQTDETFLVADINKGDIREGDSVRPE